MKLLEENIGEYLYNLGIEKGFLSHSNNYKKQKLMS